MVSGCICFSFVQNNCGKPWDACSLKSKPGLHTGRSIYMYMYIHKAKVCAHIIKEKEGVSMSVGALRHYILMFLLR